MKKVILKMVLRGLVCFAFLSVVAMLSYLISMIALVPPTEEVKEEESPAKPVVVLHKDATDTTSVVSSNAEVSTESEDSTANAIVTEVAPDSVDTLLYVSPESPLSLACDCNAAPQLRPAYIQGMLAGHPELGDAIPVLYDACVDYPYLNPQFVIAAATIESSCGKAHNGNNLFGISVPTTSGQPYTGVGFASKAEAATAWVSLVTKYYLEEGISTYSDYVAKYNPDYYSTYITEILGYANSSVNVEE